MSDSANKHSVTVAPVRPAGSQVIAVAGPIGGGKSSLVNALAQALDGATVLRFDDYETATKKSVPELAQWLQRGADFDELAAPGLAQRLQTLREASGSPAPLPGATNFIVFEMPLGRAWSATANMIDVLVWLDVPRDVALARRLLEITAGQVRGDAAGLERTLVGVRNYLEQYTSTIYAVLQVQHRVVSADADLVLDGLAYTQALAGQVLRFLEARDA